MRWLCLASLLAEGCALVLFGRAFGGPLVGLLAVRTVLTLVLVVFTLRRNVIAHVVLAGVRLMSGLVSAGMAGIAGGGGIWGLAAVELLLAALLFMNLSGQNRGGERP